MKTIQEQIREWIKLNYSNDYEICSSTEGANFALELANKWYDVKECLPEKTGYYNVELKTQLRQSTTRIFRVGLFDATRKCFAGGEELNKSIIAWKYIELK